MSRLLNAFIAVLFIGLSTNASSQEATNDPVLLEVGPRKVKVSEFEAVYRKNNPESNQKALEEYLDLYVNFRLKVQDAEDQGLDTLEKFDRELTGYRRQLAEPYLSDNEVTDALIKEAYDRMLFEVSASHIMIQIGPNAKPADTLVAHKKAMDILKKVKKGDKFEELAKNYSEDPSAKENGGHLGYFSALFMVYPFESAVYKTEVGQVTGPIRTQFGYHIIKVEDKRPNRGEITVEHIMTRIPNDGNAADKEVSRMKINEIYDQLEDGVNFEELARNFSEDKGSAVNGGLLPPFTSGRMVMSFEDASYALENDGDYSKVIETQYGFHIIKRVSLKKVGTFEEMHGDLKMRIAKDSRSRKSKIAFINRVKKEYGFKETLARRNDFYKVIDTTYFKQSWSADKASSLKAVLFTLGDSTAMQSDFAKYLQMNQRMSNKVKNIPPFVDGMYDAFVEDYLTEYENVRLETKYPEFKLLMTEYHDGILLFDLTDQKVWSKAVKDTSGLEAYYQAHKNEFMWGQRIDGAIYSTVSEDVAKEVKKLIKSKNKKGLSDSDILAQINESSQLNLEIERGKFSKGDNSITDQVEWKKGISADVSKDNRVYFVEVNEVIEAQPKELNEVKGLMTSAYQSYLEEEWIKELKAKYSVVVYKEHLSLIK